MQSSRKSLLVWAAGGLIVSVSTGLAAEQWAMNGVDPFYFSKAEVSTPFRPDPIDPPTAAPEPTTYSYAALPVVERRSPDVYVAQDDVPAADP